MNAAQELNFYLEAYIALYRNHKDILRFNKNFDTYVRHEGSTAEQMKPYNEAVNVFAEKFHTVFIKAEQDGTLRTDIPEDKLFILSMYIVLPVAAKYAEGLVYPEEETNQDMTEEGRKSFIMKIKPLHTITTAGNAASLAVISGSCGGGSSKNTADLRNYNIVFVVTEQEHYFSQCPA